MFIRMEQPKSQVILVVDAADSVRRFCRLVLSGLGYDVLEACSAEEALHVAACQTPPLDLLLTDLHLRGMSGLQLAARVLRLHPDLRILFSARTCTPLTRSRNCPDADDSFLLKPFSAHVLVARVRETFEEAEKGLEDGRESAENVEVMRPSEKQPSGQ